MEFSLLNIKQCFGDQHCGSEKEAGIGKGEINL